MEPLSGEPFGQNSPMTSAVVSLKTHDGGRNSKRKVTHHFKGVSVSVEVGSVPIHEFYRGTSILVSVPKDAWRSQLGNVAIQDAALLESLSERYLRESVLPTQGYLSYVNELTNLVGSEIVNKLVHRAALVPYRRNGEGNERG
ncbi:MAG TPA: hypothetical protein VMI55_08275 [Thermoplasmata archaeon]|nr:hypothetical protein [Thermoplasmata archaeon]